MTVIPLACADADVVMFVSPPWLRVRCSWSKANSRSLHACTNYISRAWIEFYTFMPTNSPSVSKKKKRLTHHLSSESRRVNVEGSAVISRNWPLAKTCSFRERERERERCSSLPRWLQVHVNLCFSLPFLFSSIISYRRRSIQTGPVDSSHARRYNLQMQTYEHISMVLIQTI